MTSSAQAAKPQSTGPHELLGFLLRQSPDAFTSSLGKPFQEGPHGNGSKYHAFHIPGAKDTYLVAVFEKEIANDYPVAITLELTGTDYTGPTGFLGIKLGDDASTIQSLLGKPSKISHEDDVNVDLWDYKPKNYSLEFTPDHKLYSIQIVDESNSKPEDVAGAKEAHEFALAVESGDINQLMDMASGELERMENNYSVGFRTQSARSEFEDKNGKLFACLKDAAKEILAFGPEMKGASDEIRVYENKSIGTVTKFPQSSTLKEVVFQREDDHWRVYEVTFR